MTSPTVPPTITPEEVTAYKRFSKECAKKEKQLYGKTALQDKHLKAALGSDTKIDWATTFEWALSIKNMFDREGVEAFLTKVAPDLVTKLLEIEKKTDTFLTLARALLNGLGLGDTAVFTSGPPLGAGGPAPQKLPLTPCIMPPAQPPVCVAPPAPPTSPPPAPPPSPPLMPMV